jgi:hypothetical protein
MKSRLRFFASLPLIVLLAGCASKPYDYTNFRAYPPRSLLVLTPLNESTDIRGTYGYLSSVSKPLAEMGYYVYPVAVVDQYMKENGLPTAGEMQQVPLAKLREIFGADAVLYLKIKNYGSKYKLITSTTIVSAEGKLVDLKSGTVLWAGAATVEQSSSSDNLIADLIVAAVDQAINSSTDQAHNLGYQANVMMFSTKDHGLLYGPYFPKEKQQ